MRRRDFLKTAGLAAAAPLATTSQADAVPQARSSMYGIQSSLRNRDRSTVVCQEGMVCASQPLAAMAGIRILQAGGSCIDAAIATNAVLGVTEPASNGMGGDLFAIVWDENRKQLHGLNSSGRAPREWNLQRAAERQLKSIPRLSLLSWSVPGCVRGWEELHKRFGKLPGVNTWSPPFTMRPMVSPCRP